MLAGPGGPQPGAVSSTSAEEIEMRCARGRLLSARLSRQPLGPGLEYGFHNSPGNTYFGMVAG